MTDRSDDNADPALSPPFRGRAMLEAKLKVLRFIGRHLHFRGQERLIRFFVHPDAEIDHPFEVDFFGFRYRGNLAVYADWNVYFYGAYAGYELLLILDILAAIRSRFGPQIICYDIGAIVGQHSLFMSKFADAVYGFEPYSEVRDVARERFELNGVGNVILYPYGLGDADEMRRFIAPKGANLGTGAFVSGPMGGSAPAEAAEIVHGDRFFRGTGCRRPPSSRSMSRASSRRCLRGCKKCSAGTSRWCWPKP